MDAVRPDRSALTRLHRFAIAAIFAAFFAAGDLPAIEYDDESTRLVKGVVTSVREDSLALSETEDDEKGSRRELHFTPNPGIVYTGLERWEDIREGMRVVVSYKVLQRVVEGKDAKGGTFKESTIKAREITAIELQELNADAKLLKSGY